MHLSDEMKLRSLDWLALFLLVAGLLAYGAFLITPLEDPGMRGWTVWIEAYEFMVRKEWLAGDMESNLLLGGFVTASFLAVVSPFLFPMIRKSRLAWWLLTGISLLAFIGFAVTFLFSTNSTQGAVRWLMISQGLNLSGWFLTRKSKEKSPVHAIPDPVPDSDPAI